MRGTIGEWLAQHGLGAYADSFVRNNIGVDVLADLTDSDLAALGMSLGDRKRLRRIMVARRGADGGIPDEVYDQLRNSEQRFRDFAEAASDWLWELDADLRFSYMSDSFEANFGWPVELSLGQKKEDHYAEIARTGSAEEQESWRRHFADLKAHRPFSNFLQRWVTPAGETRYILNGGKPIFDRDGRFLGYRGTASNVTDLVRAQQAARLSNRRFRDLVDALPAIVLTLNSRGEITFVNAYFEELTGYRWSEVQGKDWIETFIPARERARIRQLFAGAVQDNPTRGNINPIVTRSGEEREIEWSDTVVPGSERGTNDLLVIGTDVTDRLRTEDALKASEARLVEAQRLAKIGSWERDLRTENLYWSDEVFRIFGFAPNAFTPTMDAFIGQIHPDDLAIYRAGGIKAREEGAPFDIEHRIVRPDDTTRIVRERATLIYGADGELEKAIGTVEDVTEMRQAQRALQRSERQLRIITDSLPVLIAHLDNDRRFVSVNRTAADWLARPVEEILGKRPEDIFDTGSDVLREKAQSVLAGQPTWFEESLLYPDGKFRHVRITYVPHFDTDTEVSGFVSMVEDLTAIKEASVRLHQSQRLEALGRLTGGIAHEFNNMMQVIQVHAELLEADAGADQATLRRLRAMRSAAERGGELTDRLLSFSRRRNLSPSRIELSELIDEVVILLEGTVGDDIDLRTGIGAESWPVVADAGELQNALVNLIINARDAMGGRGLVELHAENRMLGKAALPADGDLRPGAYVKLTVTDTGPGMAPDILEQIFEPFFTTKPAGKGTGLGLSIVYGFVQQSGGFVEVLSKPGAGTSVSLFLPAEPGPAAVEPAAGPSAAAGAPQAYDAARVLVVEDDEAVRETICELLETIGHDVVAVTDGAAAIARLTDEKDIDLVISDIVMPGPISGLDLQEWLRAADPGMRLVLMTGYNERDLQPGGGDGRPDAGTVLRKPFSRTELASAVTAALLEAE
jgi:PAS domain S-box-containing protein